MDVAEKPAPVLSRWAAAFQVVICCGQIPTQTSIAALLMLAGITPEVNGQVMLPFFAALTLLDTAVVISLMHVFIKDSGESPREVFTGGRATGRGPVKNETIPRFASQAVGRRSAPRSKLVCPRLHQLWLKDGFRFSTNAAMPSF